ncbi:hypothetical protein [uncultured Dysosmobacter sp.]|uniref:hypothetical protein n=1 Tax=uncultured Dysosmobacter sp. TaxID=2591384 RepID=UPI00260874EE|nr:hypothetical protein [uncultured Dysosmobacter sp.]
MKKDFTARIARLQTVHRQQGQELLTVVYKDGHKQRLTGHEALVEAIRNGAKINYAENSDSHKVGSLFNALISEK